MKKSENDLPELHRLLVEMARSARGYSTSEVPGHDVDEVGRATCDLKRWGYVHGGKRGHRTVRYFATAEAAKAWADAGVRPATTRIPVARAPWGPGVEAVTTPQTKYTWCPSPTVAPLRTNTYGQF